MPVTAGLWRLGFLVLLLLGLVLMHHTPEQHEHTGSAAGVQAISTGHDPSTETAGWSAPSCPCPAAQTSPPALPDEGHKNLVMHLCLALAAAVVTVLACPLIVAVAGVGTGDRAVAWRGARVLVEWFVRPAPVPRRLAVLGVLRR